MRLWLIVILLLAPVARSQVLQLDAGAGNLLTSGFYSEGIGMTAYFSASEIKTSFAMRDGRPIFGISGTFMFHGLKTTIGDQAIGLNTGSIGLGLALKGLKLQKQTLDSSLEVFVGATGVATFLPFSTSTRPQHISMGVLGKRKLGNGLEISALGVLEGKQKTAVGAANYDYRNTFRASANAGVLNNNRYLQAQAAYQASRHVSFSGGHASFFSPFRATGDSINTGLTAGRWNASAGLNRSVSQGIVRTGENISVGTRVSFLSVQSSIYKSGNQRILSNSITQNFRRLTLTQIINRSDKTSLGGAVSYRAGRFSFSVGASMQFLLNGKGYQQVLYASVSLRIRDLSLNAATITNAITGKPLWNVGSENYIQTGFSQGTPSRNRGNFIFSGTVVDDLGVPVSGACLKIGNVIVYSDEMGRWELRQRHNKTQQITVLVNEFQLGKWQVVSAPVTVDTSEAVTIVVRRIH